MKIVCNLNDQFRVVEASDGRQWAIQKRAGKRNVRARWDNRGYYTTRYALLAAVRALKAEIDPSVVAELDRLPARFGRAPGGLDAKTEKLPKDAKPSRSEGKARDERYPERKSHIATKGPYCPKCGNRAPKGPGGRPWCRRCGPFPTSKVEGDDG